MKRKVKTKRRRRAHAHPLIEHILRQTLRRKPTKAEMQLAVYVFHYGDWAKP
jgi:hypothetical protein